MRKEQLSKFQAQVDSAIIGYLNLLERKELLATSINLSSPLGNLSTNIQRSILSIQDTLYSSLMINIHSWLFDNSSNSTNLSLYTLLNLLVDDEVKFNTKHLKIYYIAVPKKIALNKSISNSQSNFSSTREAEFDQVFFECTGHINILLRSEQATRIKSIRDKLLAHKDGAYDVKVNGHKIGDVFYLLEHMKTILLCLNGLFQRVGYPIDELEITAKNNAEKFWSHVSRA